MELIGFGKFVRNFRDGNKLTLARLGELIGVGRAAVSNWEHGRSYPDLYLLVRIRELSQDDLAYAFAVRSLEYLDPEVWANGNEHEENND